MTKYLTKTVFPASVFHLDNGLTFIHQEIPTTPVVVSDVWVRAGATLEPESWFGMAHFLEHMIFKGTATLSPGEFDYNIEKMGGVSNAATSHDYAHYTLTTATPYVADTLPHLGDILLNATIPDDEFIRERDVVLEEIRSCADDPDWIGFESLLKNVYQHHPYGRSVLGTEQGLMQHSPEAMRCFHHSHYQPENMTVVIVGGIGQEPALELVNRTFADFSNGAYSSKEASYSQDMVEKGSTVGELTSQRLRYRSHCPPYEKIVEPAIIGIRRQELILPRLEQARLMMAWIVPGVEKLRDAHGLDFLSVLLAEGRTSRLVHDLREEKQLVQAICSNFSLQRESSLLTITAWLEPEYLERVESLIRDHLFDLQTTGISEQELNRTRRSLCNEYAFATETPNQITALYGYYNTIAKAELAVTYPQQIQSFDAEKLQQLAQQYLSPENYAVTTIKSY